MFDFEKLEVYQKAQAFNRIVYHYLRDIQPLDQSTKNQLRRASLSIMLNIAEGSSRFSKADRKNFFVIARGSTFECVAIFDFLHGEKLIKDELKADLYSKAEEISRMLFGMIKNLG